MIPSNVSFCRFPLYLYDNPNSLGGGLQLLKRKFRFKLEKRTSPNNASDEPLVDYSGRSLKMETLATVRDLESYLYKMVRL